MVELAELRDIAAQKRLVQAQSELCRRSIQLEWEGLKLDAAWVGSSMDWVSRHRTALLLLAAPLGGVLVARRGRTIQRVLLQGFAAWQLVRRAGVLRSWFRGGR
jgi:hypothetical protein